LGHTAEIGFCLWAPTLPAILACAAQALFALMFGDEHGRRTDSGPAPAATPGRTHQVVVVTADLESLLVEWLNELLYWHEATAALVRVESVTVAMHPGAHPGAHTEARVEATVVETPPPHPPRLQVKAVTYHQLRVEPDADGWLAEVFLDI
jgi:SHS2 domain-containing protein